MARITVESFKGSLFELVNIAAERTRELINGAPSLVKRENKPPVTALRELEGKLLDIEKLREKIIAKYQRNKSFEQAEGYLDDSPVLNNNEIEEIEGDMEELSHGVPENLSGFAEENRNQ